MVNALCLDDGIWGDFYFLLCTSQQCMNFFTRMVNHMKIVIATSKNKRSKAKKGIHSIPENCR